MALATVSAGFSITGMTVAFVGAYWPVTGMGAALELANYPRWRGLGIFFEPLARLR